MWMDMSQGHFLLFIPSSEGYIAPVVKTEELLLLGPIAWVLYLQKDR